MVLQRNEMKCYGKTMFIMGYNVMFKQVVMWVPVKTGYPKRDDLLLTKTDSPASSYPETPMWGILKTGPD
jgi:hypothetical protein